MSVRFSARPSLVWIVLGLQMLAIFPDANECRQVLSLWLHPQPHVAAEGGLLAFATLAVAAVALIGLWRSRKWGWILAVLLAGYSILEDQKFLLTYTTIAFRDLRFVTFAVLELTGFVLLLSYPVREFFLNDGKVPQRGRPTPVSAGGRSLRVVTYYAVATAAPIVISAYTLALVGGRKLGGVGGFLLFLMYGFATGAVAALMFAITLTYVVRALNPARKWLWIAVGGTLAPLLMLILSILGAAFQKKDEVDLLRAPVYRGIGEYIFWGPMMLTSLRFIAPIGGIATAWICHAMYPWSFLQPFQAKRAR